MSRRSKPSGSFAPAPAVIRYLSRRPPVEVRMRISEATFSAAWARSSMGFSVLRGKVSCVQGSAKKLRRKVRPGGKLAVRTDSENISKLLELPCHDTQKHVLLYDAGWSRRDA